jgi:hypothetical protein
MKTCPACKTIYTDDTLKYCLQDGTPLAFPLETEIPTVVKDPTAWESQVTHVASAPPKKGPKMAIIVAAAALAILALIGAAFVGTWLYFRNAQTGSANNISVKANVPAQIPNTNVRPPSTSQTSPSGSPSPTRTANTSIPADPVDESEARSEVSRTLMSWKSSTESLDLEENLAHYAGHVDYYKRNGASQAFIRADKLRAFSRYDSIDFKLTNISISVDQSGQEATATFDKEWNFEGDQTSSGRVQQLLKLRKINGQWLITAEKDLKVYFTR